MRYSIVLTTRVPCIRTTTTTFWKPLTSWVAINVSKNKTTKAIQMKTGRLSCLRKPEVTSICSGISFHHHHHHQFFLFRVSNLMHLFITYLYILLHVSSHIVFIIRRFYCIYTASGSLCITLLGWLFSAQAVRGLTVHWTVTQEEWYIRNQMLCIYNRTSWWWAQYGSKHVEEFKKI